MKNILLFFIALITLIIFINCKNAPESKNNSSDATNLINDIPFEIKVVDLSVNNQLIANKIQPMVLDKVISLNKIDSKNIKILSTEILSLDDKNEIRGISIGTFNIKTVLFNYSTNQCQYFYGTIDTSNYMLTTDSLVNTNDIPVPEEDEFNYAVDILKSNGVNILQGSNGNEVEFYMPMPPIDTKSRERILYVGIIRSGKDSYNKIVGVNMSSHKIIQYPNNNPPGAKADHDHCGLPDIDRHSTKRGTDGKYQLTISKNGKEIWSMLVIRPSASSGKMGSGVELMNVRYNGTKIFQRAGVPILNVRYNEDLCGPFRDWQFKENSFTAIGDDLAEGIRLCKEKPLTALDSSATTDFGNFRGVAIYQTANEVILISEMEAGWYRYVSEWHFKIDGQIYPRFGFGAVKNSCVCKVHHHHAYWRLDFDINEANNQAQEFIPTDNIGNGTWSNLNKESKRVKDKFSKWKISNDATGEAIIIEPGKNDGEQDDKFGVGDFWVFKYHDNKEFEDGQGKVFFWDDIFGSRVEKGKANIEKFINNEPVDNTDIVIWYAAHFTHDVDEHKSHIVGPTLTPQNFKQLSELSVKK